MGHGAHPQVWAPQSKELMRQVERVQRPATKFMLGLPFRCDMSYQERLVRLNMLPLSYWHEYLDTVYFYKLVNKFIKINPSVMPRIRNTRNTRSSSNPGSVYYQVRFCKTTTFQRSHLKRSSRIWNTLASSTEGFCDGNLRYQLFAPIFFSITGTRTLWYTAITEKTHETWKTICPSCNTARHLNANITCCF